MKGKFKLLMIFLFLFLLIPLVFADITFFDNPDDVFIIGSSPTGGATIEETTGGTTGGGGCLTNWSCSFWSSCVDRIQIRNCTKEKAYCYADLKIKPVENQSCSIGTENNTKSEEGNFISQNTPVNFKNITLAVIGLIVIIGIAVFLAHNRYRKRRYYNSGY